MSFFNDEQKITKHFLDSWDAVGNTYKAIPVDTISIKKDPIGGKQIRLRVKRAPSASVALSNMRRNFGSVMVQIVVPHGSGAGEITKIADYVSGIFKAPDGRPLRLGNIGFRVASGNGPMEETSLVTMVVDVPFVSDYSD